MPCKSNCRKTAGVCTLPLLLVSAAYLIFLLPELTQTLQFDRRAIADHQYYRILSGHFTHWTALHLHIDSLVFVICSAACILAPFGRPYTAMRYLAYTAVCALGVSAAVWALYPQILYYRGLSALDWGWYGVFMGQLWSGKHWIWKSGALMMAVVFIFKMALQLHTGHSMFVTDMGAGVINLPGAHVAGTLLGLVLARSYKRWEGK